MHELEEEAAKTGMQGAFCAHGAILQARFVFACVGLMHPMQAFARCRLALPLVDAPDAVRSLNPWR